MGSVAFWDKGDILCGAVCTLRTLITSPQLQPEERGSPQLKPAKSRPDRQLLLQMDKLEKSFVLGKKKSAHAYTH